MTEKEFVDIIESTKKVVLSAVNKTLFSRFFSAIDDVVQETYLRAFKHLEAGKFKAESELTTWLYAIARNESIRMNEKLGREEKKFQKSVEKYFEKEDSKTETMEHKQESIVEEMHEKITELPLAYQETMQLLAQGFKVKEIAEKLGVKSGTVKSRASRGRELLKELLGNVGKISIL